jgi:O-antigen/teichoic acid export membrane protein
MVAQAQLRRLASVPAFFVIRIACAVALLKVSTTLLPVSAYGEFSQLIQFSAVLNVIAVGGTQNGLIRQAAAAEDEAVLASVYGAALLIWAGAALFMMIGLSLAAAKVSTVLIGRPDASLGIAAIAALSLVAGPGQIWCSILSGRKRVPASLAAQVSGLLASTAAAAIFVIKGQPQAAAIGFASGSLVSLVTAAALANRLHLRLGRWAAAARQVPALIGYSAAFAATSGYGALVLFGLRSVYREDFGPTALGYWIAANRVSDMSTQLLGLFMVQFFVAHLATIAQATDQRTFIVRCWMAGTAIMAAVLLAFWVGSAWLVPLFLSKSFLPAVPVIRTYMIGDVLRVSASLAMFTAFSRGRPGRYAAIEIGTLSLMAAIALLLMRAGDSRAPQLAYVTAYAITAMLVAVTFLWPAIRRRLQRRRPTLLVRRDERRTPRPGSDELPREFPLAPAGPSPAAPPRA